MLGTLVLNIFLAAYSTRLARERGLNPRLGTLLGLLLGVLAPLILLWLSRRPDTVPPAGGSVSHCARCRRRVEAYEGFCTVCGRRLDA